MRAVGNLLSRVTLSIVWTLAAPVAAQVVESTGFEAEDGWDAGYSICGPEFADTCSLPFPFVCEPGDHLGNQNCCEADPNEDTGWYMHSDSQHCIEPHIDTVNPFSGAQHLRFAPDSTIGSPSPLFTCIQSDQQCSGAMPPSRSAEPPQRTVISFHIAGSRAGGASFYFSAILSDIPSFFPDITVRFDPGGGILFPASASRAHGSWDTTGTYREFIVDVDPDRNVARICYDGELLRAVLFESSTVLDFKQGTLQSDNRDSFWDIDDYSVVRGGPGPSCAVTGRQCAPGPCAALVAVGINDEPIPATNNVYVQPGDQVETEIRFSGWGSDLVNGVRDYQAKLDLRDGSVMGSEGTVLPIGWDAPVLPLYCGSAGDCPAKHPICTYPGICVGPSHDPENGAFIETGRSDFIFFGSPGFISFNDILCCTLCYRYAGFRSVHIGVQDIGVPRYAGTLMLNVSEDACGTFQLDFDRNNTYLADPSPKTVRVSSLSSLQVHVCEDDGVFCNGLESCASGECVITPPPCDDGNDCTDDSCNESADACAHVVVCGACCDSWDGECENRVAEVDCNCQNCVWYPAAACANIECEAEFVVIPTVSEWGLVVLTLLLLTGGKVLFGRRPSTSI